MPHAREVRLGMVLYGGVSLAVYENGVVQELYRAIRGEGVYGLVKELTDSDIVVDIISGTSAGGVNGVMLGHALANNKDFSPVADLWRNQADIQALLRSQNDENTASVLDSGYYQQKLQECFDSLNATPAAPGPFPSDIAELDLFVSGTDANGSVSTVFDDAGHAVDVKNHRALFKLSFRRGRSGDNEKNDFKSASSADLAKLCRLTSCFPVAFEPVQVKADDKAFFRWGKLRAPAVYLDGGILNNKPFTSTIDDISRRTANREAERFLIYVEPDPEVFTDQPQAAAPHAPNVAQAAFGATVSIPGYQSIAGDLQAIESHNERMERLSSVLGVIGPTPAVPAKTFTGGSVYRAGAAVDGAYYSCRLIQLRNSAVEGILNDGGGRGYIASLGDRRSGRILVESFDHWRGDPSTTLLEFDVYLRMRRAQRLSQALMGHVKNNRSSEKVQAAWDLVNHYFKIYEILEWSMQTSLDWTDFQWKDLSCKFPDLDMESAVRQDEILSRISSDKWGQVQKRLRTLLDTEGIEVPNKPDDVARAAFYRSLRDRFTVPLKGACEGNLLQEIDRSFEDQLRQLPDDAIAGLLRAEYSRFLDVDRELFPIQFGADNESMDPIRVVRFSPKDAQRGLSQGKPAEKVCGGTLAAFGGFFKKTWRANDIMIGRLDAVCQLLECLLTRVRLAQVKTKPHFTAAQLQKYLKDLTDDQAGALVSLLNRYLTAPDKATEGDWNALIDALVEVSHRAVLAEEWPKVIDCALQQEYAWSQYRRIEDTPDKPYDHTHLHWTRAKRRPDSVLVALAAKAIAAGVVPEFKPGLIAGHPFGEEIPEPVLTELALLGYMRFSKSLIASAPNAKVRDKLQSNPLHQWVGGRVLPSLYYWTRLRRTRPDLVIVLNTIPPVAGLTILLLDVLIVFHVFGLAAPLELKVAMFLASAILFLLWWWSLRKQG